MNIYRAEVTTEKESFAWVVPAGTPVAAFRKAVSLQKVRLGSRVSVDVSIELLHKNMTWQQYKTRNTQE